MAQVTITHEDALEYHRLNGKPGKVAVVPTKPMDTQRDLSLAYSPGVAYPVIDIEKEPDATDLVMQVNHGKRKVPTLDIDGRFVAVSPFNRRQLEEALDLS